jgi:hypothetical protein
MSIQPARYNFSIWRGATYRASFELLEGDEDSDPVNLVGYSALLEIRDKPGQNVLYTLSTTNGRIALAAEGTIELTIPAADTAGFAWNTGVYDLILTTPGNVSDPYLFGAVSVNGI